MATTLLCVTADGHKAVFKTQYLPTETVLKEFNRLCAEHDLQKAVKQ